MFGFFKTREVLAFAEEIVGEFDRLQRSTSLRHDNAEKRRHKFEKLTAKIDAYSRTRRLNFYQKSRMLFAIKQGLHDKGVTDADADALLAKLVAKGLVQR